MLWRAALMFFDDPSGELDQVPVIVMTADWRAEEKATTLNASGYVRKPFDIDNLLEVIATAMSTEDSSPPFDS